MTAYDYMRHALIETALPGLSIVETNLVTNAGVSSVVASWLGELAGRISSVKAGTESLYRYAFELSRDIKKTLKQLGKEGKAEIDRIEKGDWGDAYGGGGYTNSQYLAHAEEVLLSLRKGNISITKEDMSVLKSIRLSDLRTLIRYIGQTVRESRPLVFPSNVLVESSGEDALDMAADLCQRIIVAIDKIRPFAYTISRELRALLHNKDAGSEGKPLERDVIKWVRFQDSFRREFQIMNEIPAPSGSQYQGMGDYISVVERTLNNILHAVEVWNGVSPFHHMRAPDSYGLPDVQQRLRSVEEKLRNRDYVSSAEADDASLPELHYGPRLGGY